MNYSPTFSIVRMEKGKEYVMNRFAARGWVAAITAGSLLGLAGAQAAVQKTPKKAAGAARSSGRADIGVRCQEPYLGAIAVDADTGRVLFEDGADRPGYPASVIKLMDILIIQERIEGGQLSLSNRVTVTAEAARIGGSQVYLAEKEVFSIEDLLYALMIQSANDAATALALHVGGTTAGFVELMNRRAADLGMTNTHFYSCHGLPPAAGSNPDSSTARDLATLAREVVKHPDILRYTSTRVRGFRDGKFIMRTHDHLLSEVEGCDGLKTGHIDAGGYSIVATAARGGRRVIAVVLGSPHWQGRDAKAKELLAKGFLELPPLPPPVVVPATTGMTNAPDVPKPEMPVTGHWTWAQWAGRIALGAGCVVVAVFAVAWLVRRSRRDSLP